jgi:uncharacterized membrane protein YkoI
MTACPIEALALMVAGLLLTVSHPVLGEDAGVSRRAAVERNEVVPLVSLMDWLEARYDGQVIEVELEDQQGSLVYEIDVLTPDGAKLRFSFNAGSGELLHVQGPAAAHRRPRLLETSP